MKQNKEQRGLILIQIDGLARFHLNQALKTGRLPFIKKIAGSEEPPDLSALFRCAFRHTGCPGRIVLRGQGHFPAFSFRDHESKKIARMYDPAAAVKIEKQLQRRGDGLFKGGSSYADIFSGGSRHYSFCTVSFGKDRFFRDVRLSKISAAVTNYLKMLIKSLFLMGLEAVLASVDFFQGILTGDGLGRVMAWNQSGEFFLPEHAAEILGRDHNYRKAVADDLIRLCRHPDAGTFIISGWRPAAKPPSFSVERGAHGGPGRLETDAFALLPPSATRTAGLEKRNFLRIADLREAVNRFLKS
jgi:hypothetical protein